MDFEKFYHFLGNIAFLFLFVLWIKEVNFHFISIFVIVLKYEFSCPRVYITDKKSKWKFIFLRMIFFLFSINCFYLFTSLFFHNVLIDIKHALVKTPKIDHVGHFYQGSILVMQVKNWILLFYCMTSIHLTQIQL